MALALAGCTLGRDAVTEAAPQATGPGPTPVAITEIPSGGGPIAPTAGSSATPTRSVATPTATLTVTPTVVAKPRPTPTSSGPLEFQVYVANCKKAPTAEKKGNVVIQISVEARGGNGVYTYLHKGVEQQSKFIDINFEQGTRLIDEVTVTSGDGQSLKHKFDIDTKTLNCP
jgi:hypothetical protein